MRLRLRVGIVAVLVAGLLAGSGSVGSIPSAGAGTAPRWASPAIAKIRPGAVTFTADTDGNGGQCSANFVFLDATGVYLGQAAHCALVDPLDGRSGCEAESLPLGTKVEIEGARHPGVLVYSSWLTMQKLGEKDVDACDFNDFALVRLDKRDVGRVNPTLPHWGGPTGMATTTAEGDKVFSFQSSELRFGVRELKPKEGYSLGTCCGGWTHLVYTVTPGIPGDSGSPFVDAKGKAFGLLVTSNLLPGSNGVTDLSRAVAYMHAHGGPKATLVEGTLAFSGTGVLP
jgi:hypothetical protein